MIGKAKDPEDPESRDSMLKNFIFYGHYVFQIFLRKSVQWVKLLIQNEQNVK